MLRNFFGNGLFYQETDMKISILSAAVAILAILPLGAEPPAPADHDKPPGRPGPGHKMRDMKDNLPPEIRQRFDAARSKALEDPELRALKNKMDAAGREFFQAMRAKMQEIDPGLSELVKEQAGWKDRKDNKDGKNRPAPDGPKWGNLSEAERDQLKAARAKAKEDPTVQAADKKKDAATTPADRKAASDEYRQAMRAAMVKADPSVEAVLQKLKAPPAGE